MVETASFEFGMPTATLPKKASWIAFTPAELFFKRNTMITQFQGAAQHMKPETIRITPRIGLRPAGQRAVPYSGR